MAHRTKKKTNKKSGSVYRGLYLCKDTVTHMNFPTRQHFQNWIARVEGIKADVQVIVDRREARIAMFGSEDPELEKQAYIRWLVGVQTFRRSMAEDDYVPWDVRDAVNDVENGVGLPQTVWNLRWG